MRNDQGYDLVTVVVKPVAAVMPVQSENQKKQIYFK